MTSESIFYRALRSLVSVGVLRDPRGSKIYFIGDVLRELLDAKPEMVGEKTSSFLLDSLLQSRESTDVTGD